MEICDPVHGFIQLNNWERDIINHSVFQRLRRIRQLALTNMVYPGAMHTRFEHSLGVMHVATQMFDAIKERRKKFLMEELHFTEGGLERDRMLLRLAALLHDIGHSPFSHAGEDLMPTNVATQRPYKHENYSAAVVEYLMEDVIDNHQFNHNFGIRSKEIADFLNGRPSLGRCLIWRDLISGQLDADRADYLLRDSHHIGVAYGKYDLNRLLATLTIANDEKNAPKVAIEEGGLHAAEALILARYMMFTQVYFHQARRAYDYHLACVLKSLLADSSKYPSSDGSPFFSPPTSIQDMREYLKWDDWRVLSLISENAGGMHGRIILERRHHRRIFETPESPSPSDLEFANHVWGRIANSYEGSFVDEARNSWYKFESSEVPILLSPEQGGERLTALSHRSSIILPKNWRGA
ncbi:MAG: HD domain-containing protein [Candidatus Sumerlaeota bacterium]|nr:HD domain-containing protein [Candidatus Sumerlaeota bacterium]